MYLKPRSYYEDIYDLQTIEQCLDTYKTLQDALVKERNTTFKKYSDERFTQESNKCLALYINLIKGERYRTRAKWIAERMDEDRKIQDKYDNAVPPKGIRCPKCGAPMKVTSKDLLDTLKPDSRVIFMFACSKCTKRQVLYEDGSEWKYTPPSCPKCRHPLKTDLKIKGDVSTYTSKCTMCGYTDKHVDDHAAFKRDQGAREARERDLLIKWRTKLCLSDKEGQEYLELEEKKRIGKMVFDAERKKYGSSPYERVDQLKKLSVIELEKLITPLLEKAQYVRLSLEKPEIGQYVIVPFTIQDANGKRTKEHSTSELEKLLKKSLEETNWRLMSGGISYRLGYLSGSLKGYEGEEELLELAGKKKEPLETQEVEELGMKYAGDKYIQLQKLLGQMEGENDARKRRLEKEPDGFFLNNGKSGYTCHICGGSFPGEKIWWDLRGIRCGDCQRYFKSGIIPEEIFEDDYGYPREIKQWDFQSDYGVHPSSIKKLRREGILVGRDLKTLDGTVYHTIYLVKENKEFLNKYSKKSSIEAIHQKSGE